MEQKTSPELANPEQPPDYRQKLKFEFEQRNLQLSPETLEVCSEQLQYLHNVYARYRYHNDVHSFEDIERGFILLDAIGKHIPVTQKDYALLTIIASYHDNKIHDDELMGMCAEEESAMTALGAMTAMKEYDSEDYARVTSGIMVTRATYNSDGVHQPELCTNSRDLLRFVIAFADVGAILIEGKGRLTKDVTNLALEQHAHQDNPSPVAVRQTIDSLLKMQPAFINERLSDLNRAIPHYFGTYGIEAEEKIRDEMYALFDANLRQLQPILKAISMKPATTRRLISDQIHDSDIENPAIIQQKLSNIVDKIADV